MPRAHQCTYNIACRLVEVDLHDSDERRVEVVALRVLGVEDLDRERPAKQRRVKGIQ